MQFLQMVIHNDKIDAPCDAEIYIYFLYFLFALAVLSFTPQLFGCCTGGSLRSVLIERKGNSQDQRMTFLITEGTIPSFISNVEYVVAEKASTSFSGTCGRYYRVLGSWYFRVLKL